MWQSGGEGMNAAQVILDYPPLWGVFPKFRALSRGGIANEDPVFLQPKQLRSRSCHEHSKVGAFPEM